MSRWRTRSQPSRRRPKMFSKTIVDLYQGCYRYLSKKILKKVYCLWVTHTVTLVDGRFWLVSRSMKENLGTTMVEVRDPCVLCTYMMGSQASLCEIHEPLPSTVQATSPSDEINPPTKVISICKFKCHNEGCPVLNGAFEPLLGECIHRHGVSKKLFSSCLSPHLFFLSSCAVLDDGAPNTTLLGFNNICFDMYQRVQSHQWHPIK